MKLLNLKVLMLFFIGLTLLSLTLFQNCARIDYRYTKKLNGLSSNLDSLNANSSGNDQNSNPNLINPSLDSDMDGLTDIEETQNFGTNPNLVDTDGGGVNDFDEIKYGLNPLDPMDDKALNKCNNGSGNGTETCSPSMNGNNDEAIQL